MKTANGLTKTVLVGAATLAAVALTPPLEGDSPMDVETVFIGNINNGPDTFNGTPYGNVGYEYYISKYEITQEQWTDFLNAVATDVNADAAILDLYNSNMNNPTGGFSGISRVPDSQYPGTKWSYSVADDYKHRPVVYVSLLDAKRFCNWLTNQQWDGTSDTENGVYDLKAANNAVRISTEWEKRGAVALPDENEWYKAAYYDPNKEAPGVGGYYEYSFGKVTNDTISTSNANYNYSYRDVSGGSPYVLNPVDFYKDYASAYGAVDMTGNVWVWTDTPSGSHRVVRGASYISNADTYLAAISSRVPVGSPDNDASNDGIGFRVASLAPIPEPSTYALIGGVGVIALVLAMQKKRQW